MRFGLNQRQASPEERSWLAGYGTVTEIGSLRSMARLPDGSNRR